MTLGHTFSYIVSLPVSENVSGVAIIASNLERVGKISKIISNDNVSCGCARKKLAFVPSGRYTDESSTDPGGLRRLTADSVAAAEALSAEQRCQHACLNRVRASIDQRSHIYLTAQLRCSSKRERFCQESQQF